MLFNSLEFIFLFLPVTVLGYIFLSRHQDLKYMQGWLVASSLFFYGWWKPELLPLIVVSVLFNYYLGERVERSERGKLLLGIGVAANLLTLGYFKYTDFFVANINLVSGATLPMQEILLPLGISFFTFQQIAYLVDRYRNQVSDHGLLQYALFVVFFPQLIAGPIVHHKQMMPQLTNAMGRGIKEKDIAFGISIFSIGLFKKVVIADEVAKAATPVFVAADLGSAPSLFEAWGGALAYTFQLYFDFSGYSDMAIGLGLMFGVMLPLNFASPYKATSIIDFWERWHMTLSAFLKDYLYIPLGGNRRGRLMRYRNLLLTMVLGGLWHGAAWTFVIWGALHGVFLIVNHFWRFFRSRIHSTPTLTWRGALFGRIITFLSVTIAWVFFRAETLSGALSILKGMMGLNGVVVTKRFLSFLASGNAEGASIVLAQGKAIGALPSHIILIAAPVLIAFVWLLPNTGQLISAGEKRFFGWKSNWLWVVFSSTLAAYALFVMVYFQNRISEFIYFQF